MVPPSRYGLFFCRGHFVVCRRSPSSSPTPFRSAITYHCLVLASGSHLPRPATLPLFDLVLSPSLLRFAVISFVFVPFRSSCSSHLAHVFFILSSTLPLLTILISPSLSFIHSRMLDHDHPIYSHPPRTDPGPDPSDHLFFVPTNFSFSLLSSVLPLPLFQLYQPSDHNDTPDIVEY